MSFTKDFLWGGATSAIQYEGGYNLSGRGISNLDYVPCIPIEERRQKGTTFQLDSDTYYYIKEHENEFNLANRRGSDFYHHYKEDIALFAEMGFKTFRMSIAWSRLFPTGEEEIANPAGIKFYHDVFAQLRKYNIEPLVTMIHYDIPATLTEKYNGWEDKRLVDLFFRYSKTLIDEYKDEVKYWITFNEINMTTFAPFVGAGMFVEKTKKKDGNSGKWQALHHQFLASAKTIAYCHQVAPNCQIGTMINRQEIYGLTCKPEDQLRAMQDDQFNFAFLDIAVRGKYPTALLSYFKKNDIDVEITEEDKQILASASADFIPFSYYMTWVATGDKEKQEELGTFVRFLKNEYLKASDWGWPVDPVGLRITLNRVYDRYQKPIFVVENGLGAHDDLLEGNIVHDDYRIDYLREHIKAIGQAIDDGVDVLGYTSWGCIDIVSASKTEMEKRYGYIYVDADDFGNGTYNRYKKDSFYWYKKVIETNGEDLD